MLSSSISPWISLLTAMVLLAGCTPSNGTVTINYEQLGACNGYVDGNSTVSAGPDGAFVLFKINMIDNTEGKTDFAFDPEKLYINGSSPQEFISTALSLTQKIGRLGTAAATVPAGTALPQDGYAVVRVSTARSIDPQQEANQVNYLLSYETGSGSPGVLLNKRNANQTQYSGAQDCVSKTW